MVGRRRESGIAIVFEACGTTTDAERWIEPGWGEARLSSAGRRQAKELGKRRADDEIDAVFCSDLPQAVDTARIAFAERGLPIFLDWRLRGCDYGTLSGTAVAPIEAARAEHVYDPYPGGESYGDVVGRVRRFLQDVPRGLVDGRIVVVGHPETKWALDHVLEGIPLPELVERAFHWQPGWLYTLHVDV
ncbi:MAG TPA: histidine phosphatase family protein [Gaiellaceae bacterium]|nr:histidine phosphatase family protein [Gaiellaceae bacterium]